MCMYLCVYIYIDIYVYDVCIYIHIYIYFSLGNALPTASPASANLIRQEVSIKRSLVRMSDIRLATFLGIYIKLCVYFYICV
jgi:hypothetical protein